MSLGVDVVVDNGVAYEEASEILKLPRNISSVSWH